MKASIMAPVARAIMARGITFLPITGHRMNMATVRHIMVHRILALPIMVRRMSLAMTRAITARRITFLTITGHRMNMATGRHILAHRMSVMAMGPTSMAHLIMAHQADPRRANDMGPHPWTVPVSAPPREFSSY
jgi:hypothetical protein